MLKQLLLAFSLLLLSSTVFAQEAARLLEESRNLRKQNDFTAALDKAETAVKLAPNDPECRENLAVALIYLASDSVYPGRNFGVRIPNIVATSTATLDQIEEIVRKGHRAQDLLESLPDPPECDVVFEDNDAYMAWLREKLGAFLDYWRRMKLSPLSRQSEREQVDRIATEIRRLDKRVLDHWMEHRYRPVRERVRDRLSYENHLEMLHKAAWQVFAGQTPGDLAPYYEEIVTGMLRINAIQKTDATGFRRLNELEEFNRFRVFFRRFAKSAAKQRELSAKNPDKKAGDTYERTIALMKKESLQSFRLYAWTVKNNTVSSDDASGDPKAAQRYYVALKERIREIPPGSSYYEYSILYHEMARIINNCRDKEKFDAGSGPIPCDPFTLALDIIALGTSRKEFASEAVDFLAQTTDGAEFRAKRGEPLWPGYVPADRPRYEKAVADHLRLTASQAPGIAARVKERAIRCGFKTLENIELDDMPEVNVTIMPPKNVPWKEEVRIIAGNAKGLDLRRPILHGNKLYFFSFPDLSRIRLDSVDCRSLHLQRGKTIKSPVLDKPFGGRFSEIAAFNNLYGRMPGFVDESVFYFGTGKGVLLFPLDGRDPWPLTTGDDLPSDVVQAVGMIGDKVYLGLGEENQGAWLVAIDLKTKTHEILASSAGRAGKAPFFNLSPAPRFTGFWADAQGERLLMSVAGKQGQKFPGIWSIDAKTGEFSQQASFSFTPERIVLLPDGNRMLAFRYYGTYLVDLRNGNSDESTCLLTCRNGENLWDVGKRKSLQPILKGIHCIIGTEYRDYLWGVFALPAHDKNERPPFVWGRIALDGSKEFEPLPRPGGPDSDGFGTDSFFIPSPDDSGLFVSNGKFLVYLRFEEP